MPRLLLQIIKPSMYSLSFSTDESGWAWFIPLHNGTTSVGVVMDQKAYNEKLKQAFPPSPFASSQVPNPTGSNSVALYLCNLSLAPGIIKLITSAGYMIEGSVKSGSDYSYSASCYAGNHYRIVGDAGGRSFSFSFSSWFPYGRFSFHRPLLFQRYPSQLYVGFIGRCYDLCFYSWRLLRI